MISSRSSPGATRIAPGCRPTNGVAESLVETAPGATRPGWSASGAPVPVRWLAGATRPSGLGPPRCPGDRGGPSPAERCANALAAPSPRRPGNPFRSPGRPPAEIPMLSRPDTTLARAASRLAAISGSGAGGTNPTAPPASVAATQTSISSARRTGLVAAAGETVSKTAAIFTISLFTEWLGHRLRQRRPRGRRPKGVGEVLRLVRHLAVSEFHDRHRVAGHAVIADDAFADPQVPASDNPSHREVPIGRVATPLRRDRRSAAEAFA